MLELSICLVTFLIILFYRKIYKRYITSFSIIILPYVIIILLNNWIGTRFYFYEIGTNVQLMVLIGLLSFFVGTLFNINLIESGHSWKPVTKTLQIFKIEKFLPYIRLVLVLRIFHLYYLYKQYGIIGLMANDFELLLSRGPVGHLLISIFPLMPMLFYKWLQDKRKNKEYIVLFTIFFVLAFIETEKAQVISLIIGTFIYCSAMNEKYIIKGSFVLLAFVAILFMGNYVLKFAVTELTGVDVIYYPYRLWTYIAGGLINSNQIIDSSLFIKTNAFEYVVSCLLALPNMLLNSIFEIKVGPQMEFPHLGNFLYVTSSTTGFTAQTSNVISTMTMMYGNGSLIAFVPVCFLWGMLSENILARFYKVKSEADLLPLICYMAFSMLSFFGSYYIIASFYERIIYAVLFGRLANIKFVFGTRSIIK